MIEHLTSPTAQVVSVTLLHFLWQGAAVALLYWGLQTAFRLESARVRYLLSLATLVVLAICPMLTFAVISDSISSMNPGLVDSFHEQGVYVDSHEVVTRDLQTASLQDAIENSGTVKSSGSEWNLNAFLIATQPYVLLIWFAGVMLSSARLTAGVFHIVWLRSGRMPIAATLSQRAIEFAKRMGLETAKVYSSTRIREAAVVGFWNPVVLLPASWLSALPVDVLEAVIAHELAHIRRFDVWVNLLQRVVETLLFYHPAVWWLSNQIRLEREMCCDEIAVSVTEQRGNYAIALEQVARIQAQGGLSLAPAFLGESKMNLLSRVQNVLGQAKRPERSPACLVGIMVLTVPVMLFGLTGISSSGNVAVAQEGGKSAEAEVGPRKSAEAEVGPQKSVEGKARVRKSAERDGGGSLEGFQPQSKREAALFQMIQQLQREVSDLRREVRSRGAENRFRKSDREQDAFQDGDLEQLERTGALNTLPAGWERSKVGRVFKAYDKNGDKFVSLEEWLAMTNGNISDSRHRIQTRRFQAAGIGDDQKMSQAEFNFYYTVGRYKNRRDGEGKKRGPRDGEGKQKGPRDGEGFKKGPPDGEGFKKGPRDGEGKVKSGPKDEG